MKSLFLKCSVVALLVAASAKSYAAEAQPVAHNWPAPDPAAVEHWRSLRFGMFIHWGPVSLTGHEIGWSRGAQTPVAVYDNLYKQFNPTNFNADDWVSIAKAAGLKYIVLSTKHHDGFCLWDTKLTDYNIMHSPFHRDVVKELAAACKKQGIEFGAYYSVTDWYNQDWPVTSPAGKVKREKSDLDAYEKYLQGQISELITNYGPLITIWNDVSAANDGVKSVAACLNMLIRGTGGDGNILLNVGPRPDGMIDQAQANLLKQVGDWLAKNGEAIYGTRGGPWKPCAAFVSTRKDSNIYLHVLKSENGRVELPLLPAEIKSATLLNGGKVSAAQQNGKLVVEIPASSLDSLDTIVKLEVNCQALDIPVIATEPETKK